MKTLAIAQGILILFFYVVFLPFAFLISCFKLALTLTDVFVEKGCDTFIDMVTAHLERRKK